MSKDANRLLGHADEADGIEEYDNPLPDWWLGLFWITIVWAIGYTVHYHFIADKSFETALADEMAAAEARWPEQAAAVSAPFVVTAEAVSAGEAVYTQNCLPCHGSALEGGIGPSLVDEEWIHGGQSSDVLRTIRQGVPEKGMVPWEGILDPDQINQVAAYILSKYSEATGRPIEEIAGAGGSDSDPVG